MSDEQVSAESPASGEPAQVSPEDFLRLAERAVRGAQHRFVAVIAERLSVVAQWARRHPELAEVRAVLEAVEHAVTDWSDEGVPAGLARAGGVSLVRISAQWEDWVAWARGQGWRVLKIPDVTRTSPIEGGVTGPVYLLERLPSGPPSVPNTDW